MLNSVNARPKKSTLEVMTGYFVILIFIFLCIMCAVCAFVYSIWEYRGDQLVAKYITGVDYNFAYNLLTRLGNWMLVFGTLVPISMLLTLETAKFCQGYIMGIDKGLVDKTGMECEVHSSNLNEELGQVDYIFSDKTGTLTQNEMRFKYLVIGKTAYGEKTGYTGNMPKVSNVDFSDPNAWDAAYQRAQTPEGQKMRKALQLLALCHTIVREKNGSYNASSPDELAFVNVAKLIGCEFLGMDDENYILVNECGQQKRYKLLDVFEFNSDRKRMSVVVQDERGTITLFCKGADSIIAPRYTEQSKPDLKDTMVYVDKFADIGLRTLLLGYKEVSSSEYQTFKSEYDVAKNNLDNRDKEMARVEDKFERGMTIVGATAIEDRLQDQLPETIEFIRNGGVKIWVLTGDKVDTAKNIGFSARLLVKEMEILQYPKDTPDLYQATLKLQDQQDAATQRNIKSSLLVAGDHLETIMSKQNQALFDAFSKLALGCEVVLCCRVTPKQKQEVVAMVKKALPKIVSLAIGDGANDVNMITEAHVGVGIKGVEGQQAARAADFAIGEFRLLKRLMFFHGRESYRKNSNLVLYNFFKNIMLNFPNFWFGWSNYFSGQTAYEELGYQLFNLAFTSLPIGIYALFDRQTSDVVLMKDPKYYRIGPLRLLFNSSRFVRWFIWAIAYSFIVYLIA
jgi:phospholipid-transporting ATPase